MNNKSYGLCYSNSVQFSGLEPAIEDGITDAGAHGQEVADPENEVVFLKIGHMFTILQWGHLWRVYKFLLTWTSGMKMIPRSCRMKKVFKGREETCVIMILKVCKVWMNVKSAAVSLTANIIARKDRIRVSFLSFFFSIPSESSCWCCR